MRGKTSGGHTFVPALQEKKKEAVHRTLGWGRQVHARRVIASCGPTPIPPPAKEREGAKTLTSMEAENSIYCYSDAG